MAANQIPAFLEAADPSETRLNNRRPSRRDFPHPLPCLSSRPTTTEGEIVEEVGIVEAAVFFAFCPGDNSKTITATINAGFDFDGPTVFGSATPNYYDTHKALRITLNVDSFGTLDDEPVSEEDCWAGIMAHEFLHNLGWSHPNDVYNLTMPIEIYQNCISGGHNLDSSFIR